MLAVYEVRAAHPFGGAMFELTFLCTGASTPSAERGLPALMVSCGGRRGPVDFGQGTQRPSFAPRLEFRRFHGLPATPPPLHPLLPLALLLSTLRVLRDGAP